MIQSSRRSLLSRAQAAVLGIGAAPEDNEEIRLHKSLLVGMASMIVPAAILWGGLYLYWDEPLAASIPPFGIRRRFVPQHRCARSHAALLFLPVQPATADSAAPIFSDGHAGRLRQRQWCDLMGSVEPVRSAPVFGQASGGPVVAGLPGVGGRQRRR